MTRFFPIARVAGVAAILAYAGTACASSSVSGGVSERREEEASPLARAFVTARSASGAILGITRTDDNGLYRFVELPPQRVVITASKPGYRTRLAAGRPNTSIVIDCSGGCFETAADFEMFRGAVISGMIVDPVQEAVAHARVVVRRTDPSSSDDESRQTETDDRGRFRIANLYPGAYSLTVQGDVPGNGPLTSTRNLELGEGEQIEGLLIPLGIDGAFRVSGYLRGVPTGDEYRTWIIARPAADQGRSVSSGVNADGSFEFTSLAAGRYRITGYASKRGTGDRTDRLIDVIDVEGDLEGITLQPVETAQVTGTVETAGGKMPTRAVVQVTSNDGLGRTWVRFSKSGHEFKLSGLLPGPYRFHAQSRMFYVKGIKAGGEIRSADEVFLSPGENRLTVLVAADLGRVQGRVYDPRTGRPLPHARVALEGQPGVRQVQSDQAGRFELGEVIPGEYRICAWADLPQEEIDTEVSWERAGCTSNWIPIDPESEVEIDLRAAP